jgi:hypothetical protein
MDALLDAAHLIAALNLITKMNRFPLVIGAAHPPERQQDA